MPDHDSGWDAHRLRGRSEPTPPGPGAFPPPSAWASRLYEEDTRPPVPQAPRGPRSGPKVRPVLLGVAGAVVLATLVAVPVVTHLGGRSGHGPADGRHPRLTSSSGTAPARVAPPAPILAGPGCAGGTYRRVGYYRDGKAGWLTGQGGYAAAGCDGRFDALPMSGDVKKADPTLYAEWSFDPRSARRCTVAFYVPNVPGRTYVGGSPAHYTVRQRDRTLLSFTVDQPRSLGRWVAGREFPVAGPFSVRLANTGQDWTDAKSTFAHIAAAQARATCA
jgi:hypothetical protein